MRIELDNGYVIKSDSRQFMVGKEINYEIKKTGEIETRFTNVSYVPTLSKALDAYVNKRTLGCDAAGFMEVAALLVSLEAELNTIREELNVKN